MTDQHSSSFQSMPLSAPASEPPPLPETPALSYEVRSDVVSRKRYRRLVWLTGLGWLLVVIEVFGPSAWRSLQRVIRVATGPRAVAVTAPPIATVSNAARPAAYTPAPVDQREIRAARIDSLMEPSRDAQAVAYEEDPAAARRLLDSRSSYYEYSVWNSIGMSPPQGYQAPAFLPAREIESDGSQRQDNTPDAQLFLGGLTSPSGNRRLVRVSLQLRYELANPSAKRGQPAPERVLAMRRQLQFAIQRHDQAGEYLSWVRSGQSLRITQADADNIPIEWVDGVLRANRDPTANLRIYAGQIDPKDRSHFTIDYQLNGKRGTIDGWLTDDDFLRIKPRGGKVEGGTWRIED